MRRQFCRLLVIMFLITFTVVNNVTASDRADSRILTVYFTLPETDGVDTVSGASRVVVDGELYGNMEYMANSIADTLKSDKFEIKTIQQYPTIHTPLVNQASDEKNNNARPELSTHISNFNDYDVIFIGYPIWWSDMPMPLYTFFDEYDFSGKTIVPFSSHGGSGLAGTVQKIRNLEPNANVIDGFTVSRNNIANDAKSVDKQVSEWAKNIADSIIITESTTESITESTSEYQPIYGDVDADSKYTVNDAAQILQKVLNNRHKVILEEKGYDVLKYLDVTKDNKLTAADAACVLKKALDSSFDFPHKNDNKTEYVNYNTKIIDVINNKLFEGFGEFVFPLNYGYDNDMTISDIDDLLPYHNYINADTTVEVINYMLDEVNKEHKIFYDLYSDREKQEDTQKEKTGLFFFRGNPNAPVAIICSGGGFSYVGSIHEAYPHALELSKMGYNAFVVQYRTGGARPAVEDLARAITYIYENSSDLKVDMSNYSVWGGSAGARMAAYIGSYGPAAYGGKDIPRPNMVAVNYTGHSDYTQNDPPTFTAIGENDSIASPSVMKERIDNLTALGIPTEFHLYPNLRHGFGLGIGTSAEGWIDDAVKFWEENKYYKK